MYFANLNLFLLVPKKSKSARNVAFAGTKTVNELVPLNTLAKFVVCLGFVKAVLVELIRSV